MFELSDPFLLSRKRKNCDQCHLKVPEEHVTLECIHGGDTIYPLEGAGSQFSLTRLSSIIQ